jgi:hypothetical protein
MDSTLYTKKYTISERGVVELPAGVTWKVLPRYTKFMGHLVHLEDCITVALHDEANKFQPAVVRMTTEEAEQFAATLLAVIAEKKLMDEKTK